MKLIVMQETIDHILTNHPIRIRDVEAYGEPEPVEIVDDKGMVVSKYFKFIA